MRSVLPRSSAPPSTGPNGRRAARLLLVVPLGFAALAGCGGSASESPWPVEPLDDGPGPRGEALPSTEAGDLVRAGNGEGEGAGGRDGEGASGELEPMGGTSAAGPR